MPFRYLVFYFSLSLYWNILQVKAAYKYQAEDVDELNFEVGEVINVVEYEDPEEKVQYKVLDPGGKGTDPDLILEKLSDPT